MVIVDGKQISSIPAAEGFSPDALQQDIFDIISKSAETYRYDNANQLITELKVRKGVVDASRELARSGIKFRVFKESMANSEYWNRTSEGGFELKSGVAPSDAILDIYRNGRLYGTECSTAMIIVLYKAMLDVLPLETFNRLYSGIYLMNWMHLDRDLAIVVYPTAVDEIPGDARYFSNPDVDPLKPQWQGENAYYLGGGLYYGHGIGIADADRIIRSLNGARRSGATETAYLNKIVKRQDYKQLAGYMRQSAAASSSQPAVQERTGVHQPAIQQPATQQPSTQQPATRQSATQQPATQQPATRQSATQQPATQQPATRQSATQEHTGVQQQPSRQPAAQERNGAL